MFISVGEFIAGRSSSTNSRDVTPVAENLTGGDNTVSTPYHPPLLQSVSKDEDEQLVGASNGINDDNNNITAATSV